MEGWKLKKKKKLNSSVVDQKIARLAAVIANSGSDALEEILAALLSVFPECELTLYDRKNADMLACTSLNEDVVAYIGALLKKGSLFSDIQIFSREDGHFLRQGVSAMKIIPVLSKPGEDIIFCIENYENDSFPEDELLYPIYQLIGAGVKVFKMVDQTNNMIKIDSATKLPTRDALIDQLKYLVDNEISDMCLGIISISNIQRLNYTDGLEAVDVLLKRVALDLERMLPRRVYRLGGTKFAVILPYDVYGACACLESMVDSVLRLEKRMITANVLTPVRDDAYGTIFVCESHLKTCEDDIITIVRDKADIDYQKTCQDVTETYFVKNAVAVPDENEKFYSNVDVAVNSAEELHREHMEQVPDYIQPEVREQNANPVDESASDPITADTTAEDRVDYPGSPDAEWSMPDDYEGVGDVEPPDDIPDNAMQSGDIPDDIQDTTFHGTDEDCRQEHMKSVIPEPSVFSMFDTFSDITFHE